MILASYIEKLVCKETGVGNQPTIMNLMEIYFSLQLQGVSVDYKQ